MGLREADGILQCRARLFGNELDIQKSLAKAGLVSFYQFAGGPIDALHAGNKDEVTRARQRSKCRSRY